MNFRILVTTFVLLCFISKCAWSDSADRPNPLDVYFQQVSDRAGKGDIQAMLCLGYLYELGLGTEQDPAKALTVRKAAADKGSSDGKAWVYFDEMKTDPAKGLADLHALYDGGYISAASTIGYAHEFGLVGSPDIHEALQWYQKGADADDGPAEVSLGTLYSYGKGVKEDHAKAKYWLEKAAAHDTDCFGSFFIQTNLIIRGYYHVDPAVSKSPADLSFTTGVLGINYRYDNQRAQDVTLKSSSGVDFFDQGMLQAVRTALLPPWPKSFVTDDKTMGFSMVRNPEALNPDFKHKIYAAIDAAKKFPEYVVIHGSTGSGSVVVSFDYMDGKAKDVKISKSSRDQYEDAAALQAVSDAKYPSPIDKYKGVNLPMQIAINFGEMSPPVSPTTTAAPVAATH